MSYPWTRVPEGAPPVDALQVRLLPLADLFMALMWSRPRGLSLRTAWVTPATMGLAVAAVAVVGLPGGAAIIYGVGHGQVPLTIGGIIAVGIGLGAGTLALYGIRQRLLKPVAGRS